MSLSSRIRIGGHPVERKRTDAARVRGVGVGILGIAVEEDEEVARPAFGERGKTAGVEPERDLVAGLPLSYPNEAQFLLNRTSVASRKPARSASAGVRKNAQRSLRGVRALQIGRQ